MQKSHLRFLKRLSAAVAIVVWIVMIASIFRSGMSFREEAPYCMAGTMLIFGILTGLYKWFERLETRS